MKNGKKITAAISASAVVAAMAAPVVASASTVTFTDINGNFAQAAIQKLADAGIVHGTDGKFNPNGTINKQDFVIILVNALGLDVSSAPATPSFSDVPATSYAYKYVEAAKKAGIVHGDETGKFGYNTNLQRQQMALMFANAAGADVTGKASKNNFSDNSKIGSWAADAVGYAVEQGWIHGFDGKFDPTGSATRAQVAVVASAFLDTVNANKDLKIVASATATTVGQKVTLSVPGATNVVWSVDKNGVIDASGNFVGTAVGTATVTATVNGKTLTQAISVAGAAETVKVSAAKDMVANGTSQQTLTVTAVDANGNVDTSYNGTVTVEQDSSTATAFAAADAGQSDDFDGTNLTLTNGVGTFVVQSGDIPGESSVYTVTFNNADDTTVHTAQVTVNTVEQVATSVSLDAATPQISVNDTLTPDTVTVEVLDQDGVAMTTGYYAVHLTLSGAATFGDGTTDAIDTTYTAGSPLSVDLRAIKGQTGAVTLTATSEGLKTATANLSAVVAQDASKLVLTQTNSDNTTNSWAEGTDGLVLKVNTTDANAYNTGVVDDSHNQVKVYAYNADGTPATNLSFGPDLATAQAQTFTMGADGTGIALSDAADATSGYIYVTDASTGAAPNAGDYTIVVKDGNYSDTTIKTLSSSATLKVTETANVAKAYTVTSGATIVSSSSPSTTVTLQITDAYGNPVKKAGEHILFKAAAPSGSNVGKAQFNGGIVQTAPQTTVVTDANGKATVTLTAQAHDSDVWEVTATDSDNPTFTDDSSAPVQVTVKSLPATKLAVAYSDANGGSKYADSTAYAVAGDNLGVDITMANTYGESTTQADELKAVVSKSVDVSATALDGTYTTDANGNYVFTGTESEVEGYLADVVAAKVGVVTVTVSDLSNPSVASATTSFRTVAGDFSDYMLADSTGSSTVTVASNTPVQLTLFAADAYGNRVAAPALANGAKYHINFSDQVSDSNTTYLAAEGGDFRETANGASLVANGGLDIAPGTTKTIYYVNSHAGTYDLTGSIN